MIPNKTDINPSTGKAWAVNPSSGVWDDNYWAQQVEPELIKRDPEAFFERSQRKQLELQREANRPIIESAEASIPEVQQKFSTERTRLEGQKAPLKDRYAKLLEDLKQREGSQVSSAQLNTAKEYGKRGIPLSSGAYDEALTQATRPINEFYASQGKDVALSQEENLMDVDNLIAQLTGQEVGAVRDVRNAIAATHASSSQNALQAALNLTQTQQGAVQFADQLGLQKQQAEAQRDQFNRSYSLDEKRINQGASEYERTLAEQQRQWNQNYSLDLAKFNKPAAAVASGGSGIDLSGIIKMLQGSSGSRYTPVR